ncbi:tail tape-measure protein [Bacteriophage DSS3_PM1]|nr:tail tape-measure protein [Bacteriophage DSS3_PM1]
MVDTPNRKGVRIKVTADTAKARADINKLNGTFRTVETGAARAANNIKRIAVSLGAAFAGGAAVRGINRATDSFVDMENQVALVVGRTDQLQKQMDEIYKISLKTKAPVSATAESFSRMGRALADSGASIEDINKAVVTLNKASTISGGSVESQKAAILQLGQGLASGTVRGQELNSVMEQLPRVAKAIADELGVGLGGLRALAEEGEVTTEVVFKAMLNQAEKVNDEFGNIQLTSSKAMVLLIDQVKRLTADISKATGFTDAFTQRIVKLTDYLAGNRESIVSGVVETRDKIKELIGSFKELATLDVARSFAVDTFSSVRSLAQQYLGDAEDYIRDWSQRITNYFFEIYDEVIGNSWWTDTVIETYELARTYLSKADGVVGKFRDSVIRKFEDIYSSSSRGFNFNVSATIESAGSLQNKIIEVVAEGIRRGANAISSIAPAIRKSMEVALAGAFVAVFSTGSIAKSLSKLANKLSPLLFLGLAAKLVEAVGSPSVFAAFGFLAGEFTGQVVNTFISAIPEIVTGLVSGLAGGIYGLVSEAGVLGGTAFAVTAGLIMSKSFRGLAVDLTKAFAGGTGFFGNGSSAAARLFDPKARKEMFKDLGGAFRNLAFSSILIADNALGALADTSARTARINNATLAPSFNTIGRAANFARLKTLGLAAAITLAATSAFAGTGGEGGGGGLTEVALLIGSSLIGPEIVNLVGKGFRLLGRTAAFSFVGGLLTSIGTAIAGAVAGIVAAITAPITIAIAGIVAAGGIAYVMLFGEGDSFMAKVKDVINDVKAELNLLNVSTFAASRDFSSRIGRLGNQGQLGSNRFLNNRTEDRLQNLNFLSLDDSTARELLEATSRLEQLSQKAAQEEARYNQVSEGTRKQILAAQRALLEATEAAEGNQATLGQTFSDSLGQAIANEQGALNLTSEAITSAFLPFLLNQESRNRREIMDLVQGNNLETMDDIRVLLDNLAVQDPAQLATIMGENVANAVLQLRGQSLDKQSLDAFSSLVAAQSTGDAKLIERAVKDFNDTMAEAPQRFAAAVEERSIDTLRNFRDVSNQELANIDRGELFNITKLINLLSGAERQLENAINNRTQFSDQERAERAQRVQALEAELSLAFERAVQTGIDSADFTTLTNRLLDAGLDEGLANRLSFAGQTDEIGILSGALREVEKQIEDIESGAVKWNKATEQQLAVLKLTQASLQDQFTAIASIKEIQDIKPDEIEDLLAEAIAISGLDIDLDKLFKVDPNTRKEIAELAANVLALRVAANANTEGTLGAAGADSQVDAVAQIEAASARIKGIFKGLGNSITKGVGGAAKAMTDFERLVQGTGLAIESAVQLGAKEASNIVSSLKQIETAEKAINKLALSNVEARRQQYALIEKQRQAISDILLSGNVGQAQAGLSSLGLDPEVAFRGPEAINEALRLNELYRERNELDVNNVEAIRQKTREIERQEELLKGLVENTNEMKENFGQSLQESIAGVLKGGSLKDAFYSLLDGLTNDIIDNFAQGLADSLMDSDMFKNLFDSLLNPDTFKGLGEGLMNIFKGIGGGGGGGLFSFLGSLFGGFKFFDAGGTVPFVPGAQHGKDSVPAMLKPGERVLSKNDIRNGQRGARGGSNTSTFNIEVTGDITRQTRREIMDMIPQIAQSVNAENKELNYQYR